jgi:hypothetical protein
MYMLSGSLSTYTNCLIRQKLDNKRVKSIVKDKIKYDLKSSSKKRVSKSKWHLFRSIKIR